MESSEQPSVHHLVRIAAAVAGLDEHAIRSVMQEALSHVETLHVDEVILQSYLFAGFPRALNAARAWRTISGTTAPPSDEFAGLGHAPAWQEQGERTCATVYGASFEMLRNNVRRLHPALDAWMIADGYGKVLSRPQLALKYRELCIIAACAASSQQRQLHSHFHGALNSGATREEVAAVLNSIDDLVGAEELSRYRSLLGHVFSSRADAARSAT